MAANDFINMTIPALLAAPHDVQAAFLCALVEKRIEYPDVNLMIQISELKRANEEVWFTAFTEARKFREGSEYKAADKENARRQGAVQRLENAIVKLQEKLQNNPKLVSILATKEEELAQARKELDEDFPAFAKERALAAKQKAVEDGIGLTELENELAEMSQARGRTASTTGIEFEKRGNVFMRGLMPETRTKVWLTNVKLGDGELDSVFVKWDPNTRKVASVLAVGEFKQNPDDIGPAFDRFKDTTFHFLHGQRVLKFKTFKGGVFRGLVHTDEVHGEVKFGPKAFYNVKAEDVYFVSTVPKERWSKIRNVDIGILVTRFFYNWCNEYKDPSTITEKDVQRILEPFRTASVSMTLDQVKAEYSENGKSERLIFLESE